MDKAFELAAKTFVVANLLALVLLVVGYADVQQRIGEREAAQGLQQELAVVASFAGTTQSGLRSYLGENSSIGDPVSRQLITLLAKIEESRRVLAAVDRRIGKTSPGSVELSQSSITRVDLTKLTRELTDALHFSALLLSEPALGTIEVRSDLSELSLDALARLGVAASADPYAISAEFGVVSTEESPLTIDGVRKLKAALEGRASAGKEGKLAELRHAAENLWKNWLPLDDPKRVTSARMRSQIRYASSNDFAKVLDQNLAAIDSNSDAALLGGRVALKSFEVSPSLDLAMIAYPYFVAVLTVIGALALQQGAKTGAAVPTVFSMEATGTWGVLANAVIRVGGIAFPVAVAALLALTSVSLMHGPYRPIIAWGGVVLATLAAIPAIYVAVARVPLGAPRPAKKT